MGTATPSERKRQQLLDFTLSQLAPHDAVRGVVATGSVAIGRARQGDDTVSGSDIDAVVFMDPLDLYLAQQNLSGDLLTTPTTRSSLTIPNLTESASSSTSTDTT